MIEIKITQQMLDKASELYDFYAIKNSITLGASQDYGALGEVIVMDYYDIPYSQYAPTKDYDLIFGKGTVDVKSKQVNTKPKPEYYCAVTKKSYDHQACDFYCFVRILKDMSTAWICGFINKAALKEKGHYYEKGDKDPHSNGFIFKEDCYNIPINKLSLKKSNKVNKHFFRGIGYEMDGTKHTITKFKTVSRNGFDEEIRLLYDEESENLIVQSRTINNIFNGYCATVQEFENIMNLLRVKTF